jgi:GNAT superfamily N-acetyltransferase
LALGKAEHAPLKTFLQKNAHAYEAHSLSRTYVLVEDPHTHGRVWGYVSLVASEVKTTSQNTPGSKVHWPPTYLLPAVKLARMAIDKELQGRDFGTKLLQFVLATVRDAVAQHVGVRLLITDAKSSAVGFYEKMGFTILDTPANRKRKSPVMFVPLKDLAS